MIGGSDPEKVRQMYWGDGMSAAEIGDELNVTKAAVLHGMKRYDIPRRSVSESVHMAEANEMTGGLSHHALEILVGEMLGDGCLHSVNTHTAWFIYGVGDKTHRDWLASALKDEGIKLSTNKTLRLDQRTERSYTSYTIRTRNYPCLLDIYEAWYTGPPTDAGNPSKRVPEGVEVTPALLHWWLGDGVMNEGKPLIAAHGFTDGGRDRLAGALAAEGIEATNQPSGHIYVLTASRDRFFDHMADPPAGVKEHRFP